MSVVAEPAPCEPYESAPPVVAGLACDVPLGGAVSAVPGCPMGVPYCSEVDGVVCADFGAFACDWLELPHAARPRTDATAASFDSELCR